MKRQWRSIYKAGMDTEWDTYLLAVCALWSVQTEAHHRQQWTRAPTRCTSCSSVGSRWSLTGCCPLDVTSTGWSANPVTWCSTLCNPTSIDEHIKRVFGVISLKWYRVQFVSHLLSYSHCCYGYVRTFKIATPLNKNSRPSPHGHISCLYTLLIFPGNKMHGKRLLRRYAFIENPKCSFGIWLQKWTIFLWTSHARPNRNNGLQWAHGTGCVHSRIEMKLPINKAHLISHRTTGSIFHLVPRVKQAILDHTTNIMSLSKTESLGLFDATSAVLYTVSHFTCSGVLLQRLEFSC